MKRLPALTKSIAVLIGVLFVVQIIVSFVVSSVGGTMNDLEEKTHALQFENRQLTEQIAHYEALRYLESKTSELGFIKSPVVYVTPDIPVAARLTP